MKRVLITGGAGFIGSHLADKCIEKGYYVKIIDDLSTGTIENIKHLLNNKNFSAVYDTILNRELLFDLFQDVDCVYHLAAAVGVQYIIDNPLHSLEVNVRGTDYILEAANKYKIKVLLTSTSEIYGKNENVPFKEDDDRILGSTKISRWSYSCSKALDEFLALAYFREKRLPIVIARLFNTCGPRQTGRYGMVIPKFVKAALLNHNIPVYGDGQQTRSFTSVYDVVDALIKLMESEETNGEVFNIGNTEFITIENLAKKIIAMTNSKSKIEYIPYEKAFSEGFEDMKHRLPDISKIKKYIGYEPKYSIDDILNSVIESFKK
ncbi:MAG TPA: GDP-mannose 4,6-dehydratase [bacterium]|nr:GDP-mannose 4,6-dehydratase [bacterium]HOL48252.1 GDP-mannose 4,6-dehydratase [bacterium]HPQ19367.1 GDP-mannose 4,6-dehydratase [bacterium]